MLTHQHTNNWTNITISQINELDSEKLRNLNFYLSYLNEEQLHAYITRKNSVINNSINNSNVKHLTNNNKL